jgi:23S rRNA (adenine2503-C2)-methyltransferase
VQINSDPIQITEALNATAKADPTIFKTAERAASPSVLIDGKRNLIGLSRTELAEALATIGAEKFRTKQVWQWMYHHGVTDFALMTNIAGPMREKMAEAFTVHRPKLDKDLQSIDGTRKWLLEFADSNRVETVHIPEEDRGTLCISSQVGCTLTCAFCHTGTQKLVRNLTAPEIVAQMLVARDSLGEWPTPKENRQVSNIVMMGMGEPLFNYENVAKALTIIMDPEGISLSKRKITLSTSGVVPMMERCGRELGVNLAVSLHAVNNDLRNQIVPINRKWPIEELMEACRNYYPKSETSKTNYQGGRRITFEYVMLKGVNDARELVRLLKGIPAKVNLIPFNPWPGAPFECSSNNRIRAFSEIIYQAGYASPVRATRGQDIMAACGQLKSASERLKGEKVKL